MNVEIAILPVTAFQQNCTLIWEKAGKRGTVVDPGGDLARIEDALAQIGMAVEQIVLTHGHIDHAGAATTLAERLSVPIIGPHVADKFLLDGLPEQAQRLGLEPARAVSPTRWLVEGDRVEIAGVPFDVLHCPGHSPGSVVFVDKVGRFALVGDVLFRGSVGRTDFPYGDEAGLLRAISEKLLPLGDDITFICGHGASSSFGRERQTNPFLAGAR
jgi:hydroxyacylglutathione hydrolase